MIDSPTLLIVNSASLFVDRQSISSSDLKLPGILAVHICRGGQGWPTPVDVGISLDIMHNQGIVNWPLPCNPVELEYEDKVIVVCLDTSNEAEIEDAAFVKLEGYRDDW